MTAKRISTKIFEAKLFPNFITFNTELTVSNPSSDFLKAFISQLSTIYGLIENGFFAKDYITDYHGSDIEVKKNDYKNPPDHVIEAIKSHGLEHSLSYQVFRMIYSFKRHSVGVSSDICGESENDYINIIETNFNVDNFDYRKLNPLARFYYKYAVVLEKELVKTALYAKDKDSPKQYTLEMNIPSPHIVSEIYCTFPGENVVIFNIPNVFSEKNVDYLTLPIKIEDDITFNVVKDGFEKTQNIFLSMVHLNETSDLVLKFDGLNVTNEFFLNRRASMNEKDGVESSDDFYRVKLSEINIDTDTKEVYSSRKSSLLRRKREKIEKNMKDLIDEEDYSTRIYRSKQIMHGIKNNRGES